MSLPKLEDIKLPEEQPCDCEKCYKCANANPKLTSEEKLKMSWVVIDRLMTLLEGLEEQGDFNYTGSDDILYAGETLKAIDCELTSEWSAEQLREYTGVKK